MARGWERKSVESQIEAAEERAERANHARMSAEQAALERERESLELSRTRVLNDIAAAQHPRYIEQLQRTLEFLEAKLAAFSPSKPDPRG